MSEEGFNDILEPPNQDEVENLSWTGSKDTSFVMLSKTNGVKSIQEVVLRLKFQSHKVSTLNQIVDGCWSSL